MIFGSIGEWGLVTSHGLFMLTLAADFRHVQLQLPKIISLYDSSQKGISTSEYKVKDSNDPNLRDRLDANENCI